jgi:hypothetical protein
MAELTRFPAWLRYALGLADPDLPVNLESNAGILATVDALGGGILEGLSFTRNTLVPSGTPAGSVFFTSSGELAMSSGGFSTLYDENYGALLWLGMENTTGGAYELRVRRYLKPETNTPDFALQWWGNIGGGQGVGHSNMFGTDRPLILPPSTGIEVSYPAIGGVGGVLVQGVGFRLPAQILRDIT